MSYQKYVSQHFLGIVVALQIAMYVSLFLNLSIAREVIGIFYLSFIPGFLFIKILKLQLETVEFFVFAAGFSIAFLMFSGLIINQFGVLVGISFPLSTLPLSLFINTLVLGAAAVAYLRRGNKTIDNLAPKLSIHPAYGILALIPLLSIIGTYFVNTTGNSFYLLLMILSIALVAVVVAFYEKSTNVYAFAIFMIALALLFQTSLISNYILPYGGDVPAEFYVFKTTQMHSLWNPVFQVASDQNFGRFNAMLSITILPTIYSNMLGMDPTWVFKIIYPMIFALVPLGLYVLWQRYIGKKSAFLAVFLFMAQATFFTEMTALNRQMIAELFFVLLLLVILNKKLKLETKFLTFAIFSFALIVSHYGIALIFLFLIFVAWAFSLFYLKKRSFNLQFSMVLFFSVALFGWYIYTSGGTVFDSLMSFTNYVTGQLGGFLNPASRGDTVLTGLGLTQSPSFLNTVSRGFAYITEIFIAIGIIGLLLRKTRFTFDRDFSLFSLVAAAFLVALTVVPGLANTLDMTRFYHILLMLLAPFCIVGMWTLVQFVFKHEKKIVVALLVVAVLVPYFLFQTNFVFEVAKTESWSIPLSGYRMNPMQLYGSYGYIDSYSVYGAEWVYNNVPYQYNLLGDNGLYTALTAYGLIYRGYVGPVTNSSLLKPGRICLLKLHKYRVFKWHKLSVN